MQNEVFSNRLQQEPELLVWLQPLLDQVDKKLSHGDMEKWQAAIDSLPEVSPGGVDLSNCVAIGSPDDLDLESRAQMETQLKQLHPWRKGPYDLFGIHIDTEWRSDWKWDRLSQHISDLNGRKVLDVGCGNGYHCWRMAGAGADTVIGIDPTLVFVMQYQAIQRYINSQQVVVLPFGIDDVAKSPVFDTVFSMGVLYHRRSPLDHLIELRHLLRPGGELVLETLVIEAGEREVLVPQDRYAQMRNVWFLPSCDLLQVWLSRCGYKNIKLVDVTCTTVDEQRTTEWMRFQSLSDFLMPEDQSRTIEGYSAPVRAIFTAET